RFGLQLDRHFPLYAANDLYLGDTGNSFQLAGDVGIGETRQLRRRHRLRVHRNRHDRDVSRVEALQHRLLHLDGKIGADRRDRVANVLRADLRILLEHEEVDDLGIAISGGAEDLIAAGDSLDRVLEGLQNLALYSLGRRTRIGNKSQNDGLLNVGELVGLQSP